MPIRGFVVTPERERPHLIVLLTDFGSEDPYVGIMKGVILSICPNATILDLCHQVGAQNRVQGAFFLKGSYPFFPPGTIFICVVDPGVGTKRKGVAIRTKNYFFVGPDNGIFESIAHQEPVREIRSIENKKFFWKKGVRSSTFHGRDIFAPVAAHLALDSRIYRKLGKKILRLSPLKVPCVRRKSNEVRGVILFFDRFGNGISNICLSDSEKGFWDQAEVSISGENLGIIKKTYGAARNAVIALFNSYEQLEIAIPGGSALDQGQIDIGSSIIVKAKK